MFCYQQNFFTPTKVVTPELFWALVGAPYTKELIDGIRTAKDLAAAYRAETDDPGIPFSHSEEEIKALEQKAAALKKKLPAFVFQATFDETTSKKGYQGMWRKQSATRLNGLCVLDVDHVEAPRAVFNGWLSSTVGTNSSICPQKDGNHAGADKNKIMSLQEVAVTTEGADKNKIMSLQSILLVYVTPSGHGLKVVFKADPQKGNLIDNMNAMATVLGVEADQSCKDASRMSFVCTKEDILYINEDELFTYENKEFAQRYEPQYRSGNSQPKAPLSPPEGKAPLSPPEGGTIESHSKVKTIEAPSGAVGGAFPSGAVGGAFPSGAVGGAVGASGAGALKFHTLDWYLKVIDCWLGHKQPQVSERHKTSLMLADHLRYVCDNDAGEIEAVLRELPFVKDIVAERNEDVAQTVKSAMQYNFYRNNPKRLQAAIAEASAVATGSQDKAQDDEADAPDKMIADLNVWGKEIEGFFGDYPCLQAACGDVHASGYPAAMFVAAAFFGTLMTRTWYYFYHRPNVERRLNYCILIIGDPASGKSFATKLYDIIAAPIRAADQVGYDAMNKYKRDVKARSTSTKAQKDEPLVKPEPVIRDHPSRTSNAIFLADMHNAVEEVVYKSSAGIMETKSMNLHMLTFDSELDNSVANQKGGSWIDKQALELKAFHNETDGQAYANLDSVMGMFKVYWNFVYTGTPLSLTHKVNERNFGSGMATRMAVIKLPPSGYKMMELTKSTVGDTKAEELLKEWAFRLDGVSGELPLWPLVEETWAWASEQMAVAEVNASKPDELLLKRVPYYGISIAAPFVLMRHWEEWQNTATFAVDDTDRRLCRLIMRIQYASQKYFFGDYAQKYFENMRLGDTVRHREKFDISFSSLPQEFTLEDVSRCFGLKKNSARAIASRLVKEGKVENLSEKGSFSRYRKKE